MMKSIAVSLLAATLLLVVPQVSHADQFTQIQSSPNTYWVPAPSSYPQPGYVAAPAPYGYYPQPGCVVAPPPPAYYYGPRPYYYGPPPVAAAYYGGGGGGSRVYIGLPGLFFGFHIH